MSAIVERAGLGREGLYKALASGAKPRYGRATLSAVPDGRAGTSPEMAVRLSIALGAIPAGWMIQQMQYDPWHAEKRRMDVRISRVAV